MRVECYSTQSALWRKNQPHARRTPHIRGAYYYQAISQNFDAFVNGLFQSAVKHKMD